MVLWLKTSCFFLSVFFFLCGAFPDILPITITLLCRPRLVDISLRWRFLFFSKVMGNLSWKRPSEFVCYNVSSAVKSIQHLHLWYERNMHKYMYISTPFTAYMYIYRYILSIQYVLCITYSSHQNPSISIVQQNTQVESLNTPNQPFLRMQKCFSRPKSPGGRTHYWQSEEETKNIQVSPTIWVTWTTPVPT